MKKNAGGYADEAFKRIGDFKMDPQKKIHDYKPATADMDLIFPKYATRDRETQAHWSLRLGWFWGNARNGLTAEAGGQYHLPRLGIFRPQANLGLTLTHDWEGRSEFGLKGSFMLGDYVDLFGAGLAGTVGLTDSKDFFYGVEGVVKLSEGNFLFRAGPFWYPKDQAEIRISIFLDVFAWARSFEWVDRSF